VETYAEDFHDEKEERRKKESMWDNKFTTIRAENEKFQRQVRCF
jgi:hypothetical protein